MNRMPAFRSVLVLAIILLVPLMAVPGNAWHGSGNITALAIDPQTPTTLYAGTEDRGVFKSTDGGASWSATNLTGIYIGALAVDPLTPSTLYAGAYHPWTDPVDSGVFKSTDGGMTWTGTLLSGVYVVALAIDPQTPTTLYAGSLSYGFWDPDGYYYYSDAGGVFKSTDGGATWGPAALRNVGTLAIDPVTPSTVYASGYDFNYVTGVFKSMDGGATWSATGLTGDIVDLAIDPVTPSTVYASGYDFNYVRRVFKSMDGGATWSATGLTELIWDLEIDPQTPTVLYAGSHPGAYKSVDGGTTWSAINTGLTDVLLSFGAFPAVGALAIEPLTPTTDPNQPLAVYAGTSIGVFKSTDGGARWTPTGLFQHSPLASVSLNPTTVVGGTASTGTVILVSAAPVGGVTVTLSSSDPAATVPASVMVPAGATSADFTITTNSVTESILVLISASFDGATRYALLTVNPVSPPDTEPPDTSITSAVDGNGASVPNDGVTLSNGITLAFSGTDNVEVAEFECRLDGAAFTSCRSPVTYSGLAVGPHDFDVRAVDAANNRDGTPAAYTWTVDSPPETTITSAVDWQGNPIPDGGLTRSSRITFSFTGKDNVRVTGFECSLDGAAFTSCTSPITYVGGGRGTHTFLVRAIDNNGFRDPTPAAFTWTR